jgi:hypothetical protein
MANARDFTPRVVVVDDAWGRRNARAAVDDR